MAFKQPGTVWDYENDDVQAQVVKVVDQGGPLMKQAKGLGQMKASARGLGNSTLAAKASQEAVLDKAVAIGGQNAQQIYGKNLAEMQAAHTKALQAAGDVASMDRLQAQLNSSMVELEKKIAADRELAAAGDAAAMERLKLSEDNRLTLQGMADEAAMKRTELDAQTRMNLQTAADTAALKRQVSDSASRQALQTQTDAAAQRRLEAELSQRTAMGQAELQSQEKRQALDNQARLAIADAEIAANARNTTINAMTNLQSSYMSALSASMSNADIPADARAAFQKSLKDATGASMAMITDAEPVEIKWSAPAPTAQPTRVNWTPPAPPPSGGSLFAQ